MHEHVVWLTSLCLLQRREYKSKFLDMDTEYLCTWACHINLYMLQRREYKSKFLDMDTEYSVYMGIPY